MTICNMSIEWGARAGMIAPDDTTFAYLEGATARAAGSGLGARGRPTGARSPTRPGRGLRHARRRRRRRARAAGDLGHEPRHGRPRHGHRPRSRRRSTIPTTGSAASGRSSTWGFGPGSAIEDIRDRPRLHRLLHELADRGSPRRRGDRRGPARSTDGVTALVVPGSAQVRRQAEDEGLDRIFLDAGFEWRLAGLLDVPRHEPGRPRPGRALRLDVEPELRGPPGPRRPHAPRQPADGGRRRAPRALRRRAHARREAVPA